MHKVLALIDCNNFFVSCERIFRPELANKPVGVLSNNDGCFIARSNELKALGVYMGAPLHKVKDIVAAHNVVVFSANFALYGDISTRIQHILEAFSPDVEAYSIDECFIDLSFLPEEKLQSYCQNIRDSIMQQLGVPVSIGIASTKTLAKIASHIAKKDSNSKGVFNLYKNSELDKHLYKFDVREVWGVGWNLELTLKANNIHTALDLKNVDIAWARSAMTVIMQRTVLELNETACLQLNETTDHHHSIISSRTFGKYLTKKEEIEKPVASFTSKIGIKLRKQKLLASWIYVKIKTNRHSSQHKYVSYSSIIKLPYPTNYTPLLIENALKVLDKIFKSGHYYYKAEVMVVELIPEENLQHNIFEQESYEQRYAKHNKLMNVIDKINTKAKSMLIQNAVITFDNSWKSKSELISKAYTTNWNELLQIKI